MHAVVGITFAIVPRSLLVIFSASGVKNVLMLFVVIVAAALLSRSAKCSRIARFVSLHLLSSFDREFSPSLSIVCKWCVHDYKVDIAKGEGCLPVLCDMVAVEVADSS